MIQYTIRELLSYATEILDNSGIPSALLNAEILFCDKYKFSKKDLLLKQNEVLSDSISDSFFKIIAERATRKPIQYIIGNIFFYNVSLEINSNALIPRPETEQLVDIIVKQYTDFTSSSFQILDLCTGSGCIALALGKQFINSHIDAVDISSAAIELALKNQHILNIANVKFINASIEKFFISNNNKYDIIVCNPPYISDSDYFLLEPELYFEPQIALTDNSDGLTFFKIISNPLKDILTTGGICYFECGLHQASEIIKTYNLNGFKATPIKDFANINRFVKITF